MAGEASVFKEYKMKMKNETTRGIQICKCKVRVVMNESLKWCEKKILKAEMIERTYRNFFYADRVVLSDQKQSIAFYQTR